MRFACALMLAVTLSSCNTSIGVGRDIKEGFIWSKNKIQEKRAQGQQQQQGGGYFDDGGAPVY
jgi:hypothetical protein